MKIVCISALIILLSASIYLNVFTVKTALKYKETAAEILDACKIEYQLRTMFNAPSNIRQLTKSNNCFMPDKKNARFLAVYITVEPVCPSCREIVIESFKRLKEKKIINIDYVEIRYSQNNEALSYRSNKVIASNHALFEQLNTKNKQAIIIYDRLSGKVMHVRIIPGYSDSYDFQILYREILKSLML